MKVCPDVSVIMSCCSSSDRTSITAAVESILNQTITNFEFIICVDGLNEALVTLLKEYEAKDNRVKVIGYRRQQGLAFAMNYCITRSSGRFIARMDDDDYSEVFRLERQISFLNNNPDVDFVGTSVQFVDRQGHYKSISKVINKPTKKDFYWNSPFTHPTVMFRKEALNKVNGYRVAWDTQRGQDYDLFMRLYSVGCKGANIPEPLYRYSLPEGRGKYRPIKLRLAEASVRLKGYKAMHILIGGIPYIVKPLIIGIFPERLVSKFRTWK